MPLSQLPALLSAWLGEIATALERRSAPRLLRLLLLLLGRLHAGRLRGMLRHEEVLPAEQHADGQNYSEDEIAVVFVHVAFAIRPRELARSEWQGPRILV